MSRVPVESYIVHSEANGVLPLGPVCHDGCVFCSHRNACDDPAARDHLRPFYEYRRDPDEAIAHASFLDPEKRVIIGESATKLAEGEPLMFPRFMEVLESARGRVEKKLICITTSGGFFSEEFFNSIGRLAPLEINVSINALDPAIRDRIVRDRRSVKAAESLLRLMRLSSKNAFGPGALRVNASLMAVSASLTPVASIAAAIENLRSAGGLDVIRVYLPRFASSLFSSFFSGRAEYERYSGSVTETLEGVNGAEGTPVIVEPLAPPDLSVTVAGVVRGSRAHSAGIRAGETILAVNGVKPLTRSHAHHLLSKAGGRVTITAAPSGGGPARALSFEAFDGRREGAAGMLFVSDASAAEIDGLKKAESRLDAENSSAALVTTPLSLGYIEKLLSAHRIGRIRPLAVPNLTFGGNIDCAGLLSLCDIETAVSNSLNEGLFPERGAGGVILAAKMFDHLGRDVTGRTIDESCLAESFGLSSI